MHFLVYIIILLFYELAKFKHSSPEAKLELENDCLYVIFLFVRVKYTIYTYIFTFLVGRVKQYCDCSAQSFLKQKRKKRNTN